MAEAQAGQSASRFERVSQQYRVGMSTAEVALPASPAVVRFGQKLVQRFIVSRQRARSMAGEIRSYDSVVFDWSLDPETRCHAIDDRSIDRTPSRMWMKAAPLIQEHTLGAFEQRTTRLAQLAADCFARCG